MKLIKNEDEFKANIFRSEKTETGISDYDIKGNLIHYTFFGQEVWRKYEDNKLVHQKDNYGNKTYYNVDGYNEMNIINHEKFWVNKDNNNRIIEMKFDDGHITYYKYTSKGLESNTIYTDGSTCVTLEDDKGIHLISSNGSETKTQFDKTQFLYRSNKDKPFQIVNNNDKK